MTAPVKERRPEAAPAAPVRPVRLGPRDVTVERRRDGTIHLTSPHALAPYPEKLSERLEHWAATAPERVFLAQRDAAGGFLVQELRQRVDDPAHGTGACVGLGHPRQPRRTSRADRR